MFLIRDWLRVCIRGSLLLWLNNFLKQRQERVVINGNLSKWTDVLSGIPQGSIL